MDIIRTNKSIISDFVVKRNGTFEMLGGIMSGSTSVAFPSEIVGKSLQAVLFSYEFEKSLSNDNGELLSMGFDIPNQSRVGDFVRNNFIWLPISVVIPTAVPWRYSVSTTSFDDRFINYTVTYFYSDQARILIPEM
jgi:hypothetical protein